MLHVLASVLRTTVARKELRDPLVVGALQIQASMKTQNFDWLTYDYDSSRNEEILVEHFTNGSSESWISLDRPEDRTAEGTLNPAVLADALEEAGADASLVWHLRAPGSVHVRGCYVLDLLLGKS